MAEEKTRKLAIVCSKGSLDMAYPGLVLANAARMVGIEVFLFFTFWGMDIITKSKLDKLKVTPLGNTSMGMPGIVGVIPGVTAMATTMMKREIDKLDIPPIDEFIEMVHDAGATLYACQMSYEMMKLSEDDLVDQVDSVVTAMDFMDFSEGAQIIFI
jgi:peroxiredoxin family protein